MSGAFVVQGVETVPVEGREHSQRLVELPRVSLAKAANDLSVQSTVQRFEGESERNKLIETPPALLAKIKTTDSTYQTVPVKSFLISQAQAPENEDDKRHACFHQKEQIDSRCFTTQLCCVFQESIEAETSKGSDALKKQFSHVSDKLKEVSETSHCSLTLECIKM